MITLWRMTEAGRTRIRWPPISPAADGTARGIGTSALYRGAEADTERLRGLPRLQETADRLDHD
jgi:hypothetical protein